MGATNKYIALLLTPLMMICNLPLFAVAMEQPKQPTAEIVHNPVETTKAGQRVTLEAEIEDKNGIEVVRVYFKAEDGADYNFVEMKPDADSTPPIIAETFSAVLPAPTNGAKSFTYLILIKNSFNVVVKSQNYWVKVEPSNDKPKPGDKPIKVYTELDQIPSQITGFSDNIIFDTVESAAKFGAVAGLYQALMNRGADGVVYGGTVAASTEGIGAGTIILGGLVVAALAGGAVALASSSSDDSSSTTTTTTTTTACSYEGTWSGTYSETDCGDFSYSGTWSGSVNSSCSFSATDENKEAFLTGTISADTGAATVSGTRVSCTEPIAGTATFSTRSVSGSYSGGATGTFSGSKQ